MTTNYPYKIVLIDDHAFSNDGVAAFLMKQPQLEVIAVFQEISSLNSHPLLKPDLILLDLNFRKGINGIQACAKLKRAFNCKIIAFTQYELEDINLDRNNFDGYINKNDNQFLTEAINEVMVGRKYFVDRSQRINANTLTEEDPFLKEIRISDREKEVMDLVAQGKTSKEIAALLFISIETVKNHRKKFKRKSNVRTLADVIRFINKGNKQML